MYRERPSRLPGAVVWTGNSGGETRVLPDGCMDLIYRDGQIMIAGPDTRAHVVDGDNWSTAVGLRFAPGFGPRVIGVPAHAFADLRVPLDQVWSQGDVQQLVDRLRKSDDAGKTLEDIARERAATDDPEARLIDDIARRAQHGDPVTTIAAAVGFGTRRCIGVAQTRSATARKRSAESCG